MRHTFDRPGMTCPNELLNYSSSMRPIPRLSLTWARWRWIIGIALRQAGFEDTTMVGTDISSEMLKVANHRGCYDDTRLVNLNEPLPFETDSFDAVTCIREKSRPTSIQKPGLSRSLSVLQRKGATFATPTAQINWRTGRVRKNVLVAEGKWSPCWRLDLFPTFQRIQNMETRFKPYCISTAFFKSQVTKRRTWKKVSVNNRRSTIWWDILYLDVQVVVVITEKKCNAKVD